MQSRRRHGSRAAAAAAAASDRVALSAACLWLNLSRDACVAPRARALSRALFSARTRARSLSRWCSRRACRPSSNTAARHRNAARATHALAMRRDTRSPRMPPRVLRTTGSRLPPPLSSCALPRRGPQATWPSHTRRVVSVYRLRAIGGGTCSAQVSPILRCSPPTTTPMQHSRRSCLRMRCAARARSSVQPQSASAGAVRATGRPAGRG